MAEFDVSAFLQTLTQRAGVYRMFAADDELLYVGKAKNLKNRVSSYFRARGLNSKTVALVSRIDHIEVTVTASEAEALLLEQTLIMRMAVSDFHLTPPSIEDKRVAWPACR